MPAWPLRPSTVTVASSEPRHAIQTAEARWARARSRRPRAGADAETRPPAPVVSSSLTVLTSRSPRRPTPSSGQCLRGKRHRRDAALHVAGAAAVDRPVAHLAAERVARPVLARLDRDDVDVAVQQQRRAAARAGESREQLRPPRERETVGDEGVTGQRAGVGLLELHVGAVPAQPGGQVALQLGNVAGGGADVGGDRVEADQRLQQLDEVALASGDVLADALLQRGQQSGCTRSPTRTVPGRSTSA